MPQASRAAADPGHDGTVSPGPAARIQDAAASGEHAKMAVQHDSPVTGAVRSLEVRWILPGPLDPRVARWFARFPAQLKSYEDLYLLDPDLPGLSVKIRAGRPFEVKAYRGSAGILEVAGRACGRMESWQKWSFPCDPPGLDIGDPPGWRRVEKNRRVSPRPLAAVRAPGPGSGEGARCEVELTEIWTRGQAWWTLGFEATGPAGCCGPNSRPRPRSCSARLCRAVRYWAWMTPRPTRNGCPSAGAPADAGPGAAAVVRFRLVIGGYGCISLVGCKPAGRCAEMLAGAGPRGG